MNINILGENVKKIREEKKLSVRELSRISGVSITTISLLENGKRNGASEDTISKLSKALFVEPSKLFEAEEGKYEVTEFIDAITLILNSDDVCIHGKTLSKDEKSKLIFACSGLEAAIINERKSK